ncbi:MAG: S41 family peptidase [Candidatus Heteroscillospira sp.]|jgi:carboxyl-terminal processing protease
MKHNRSFLKCLVTALLSSALTLAVAFTALCVFAGGTDNLVRGAKLTQMLNIIDREFVVEADLDELTDKAASAMVDGLDDRWSYYMTADQYSKYQLRTQNSYRGIGVTVVAEEMGFALVGVTRDTPAFEAGLLPGEKLTEFDGESMAGWTTEQLQEKIYGCGDESFTLTVLSEAGEERQVTLSTAQVYSSPVSSTMLPGDVGYIILKNFSSGCSEDAIAAIEELTGQGAKSLVFDVRWNGGGYVHELTALLDYLLPEGDIFISRDRDGRETVTTSDEAHIDLPMAVLINSESYSAAELFAAQLSEYGAAVTVGEATTGKGRSQISYTLFDGSAAHISHEAYLTSQRRDLAQEGGIVPDLPVEISQEEKNSLYYGLLEPENDSQLQAAADAVR